jgi:putative membrane protein
MQQLGFLSTHMAQHIILMNVLAPMAALMLRRTLGLVSSESLTPATVVQIVLIWAWHAPPILPIAVADPLMHTVMMTSLFGSSLWFWCAVVADGRSEGWKAILPLLVTSKLFCLLGVLLVFAPRELFSFRSVHDIQHDYLALDVMADQQLAGLMMLVACPATYLLAGVIVSARWLRSLEDRSVGSRGRAGA